jgi:hypothetical protein
MNRFAQAQQESRIRRQRIEAAGTQETTEPTEPAYQGLMDVTA